MKKQEDVWGRTKLTITKTEQSYLLKAAAIMRWLGRNLITETITDDEVAKALEAAATDYGPKVKPAEVAAAQAEVTKEVDDVRGNDDNTEGAGSVLHGDVDEPAVAGAEGQARDLRDGEARVGAAGAA